MRVAYVLVFVAAACGKNGNNEPPDAPDIPGFDRNVMLTHLATNVMLPMQQALATKTAALPASIDTYCTALEAGNVGTTRDAAVTAWGEAMDTWGRAEALLVGPAAMDNKTLAGNIYSWPLISPCLLNRDTVTLANTPASYDIATRGINARSLAAIEFLLFSTNTAHTCVAEPAGWTALQPQLPQARCRLAQAIAVDVAAQAATVETGWRADGGNFVGQLSTAGAAGTGFASAHAAINVVSDSLFFVDKSVKDMKLGETAGITMNSCLTVGEPCLPEVELLLGDRGTFAIRANLDSLRQGFTGTSPTADGPGFDDFLIAAGHPDVSTRMLANLDAAIADAAALPDSFVTALGSNYSAVVDTHTKVRAFTDDLKSQFLTLLALEIPDDVATDND